jgi:hypothetical protein
MSDIDIAGATEALAADLPDSYEDVDQPISSDESVVGDNPDVESFTGFDPNSLPDDLQAVYKSMQADYTRKTQDLASLRQYESLAQMGVDPNDAVQMVSFFQDMQNDPQLAVEYLSSLQSQIEQVPDNQFVEGYTPDSYEGLPPDLANELAAMRDFREQYFAQQEQMEIMAGLEMEEQQIRVANPHYSDDDVEAIYNLAYSTGGDLKAAADQYHGIQQRLLGGYLEAKQAPMGATPAPVGGSNIPPKSFANLDEAHKAAMEALRNTL